MIPISVAVALALGSTAFVGILAFFVGFGIAREQTATEAREAREAGHDRGFQVGHVAGRASVVDELSGFLATLEDA